MDPVCSWVGRTHEALTGTMAGKTAAGDEITTTTANTGDGSGAGTAAGIVSATAATGLVTTAAAIWRDISVTIAMTAGFVVTTHRVVMLSVTEP